MKSDLDSYMWKIISWPLSIELETIISAQNRFIITICFHSINYFSCLTVLCILLSAYCYVFSNKQFIAQLLCPKQVSSFHDVYVKGRAAVNAAFMFYFICFHSIRYSGDSTLISLQNTWISMFVQTLVLVRRCWFMLVWKICWIWEVMTHDWVAWYFRRIRLQFVHSDL